MSIAFISHQDCLLHEMGAGHPESPARLQVIENELKPTGLFNKLRYYDAPLAEREQLIRVHDPKYVDQIFQISPQKGRVQLDPDTSMNPFTLQAALRAAGSGILAVDLVMAEKVSAAFCSVRPPGHHAERDKAMGFCFFNNVAIAAAHALEKYHLKRAVIVDFDVHHGNGTENIFQNDKRILLCSSFQSPFYPYSGDQTRSDHIINVPLRAGTTGTQFRAAVEHAWFDRIQAFQPEIVFFSAGFDAYYKDEMANLSLYEEDYFWITEEIKFIADECCPGKIVSMLEGGYNLEGLGACAAAHIEALF